MEYRPHLIFKNQHAQTIYPALFRKVKGVKYVRERYTTQDGDFIDLDWSKAGSKKLVIILHGLEGSSDSQYMLGAVRALNENGFDTVAVNFRGCSGSANNLLRSYHSGATEDITSFIDSFLKDETYEEIFLLGFSLGGNVSLKYLGEAGRDTKISKAVAISVPCDLKSSAYHLKKGFNRVYLNRFLKRLKKKVRQKETAHPGQMDYAPVYKAKDFKMFDDLFTAPVHGFKDAHDYWQQCSSRQFIGAIDTPTLLINALNDPFLPELCYPFKECADNKYLTFLTPKHGGHVGFPQFKSGMNWYEQKIVEFFN